MSTATAATRIVTICLRDTQTRNHARTQTALVSICEQWTIEHAVLIAPERSVVVRKALRVRGGCGGSEGAMVRTQPHRHPVVVAGSERVAGQGGARVRDRGTRKHLACHGAVGTGSGNHNTVEAHASVVEGQPPGVAPVPCVA